ncbi:MAG: hypothetical protein ACLFS3_01940 [Candidatus Aenigmatarchaeota archaeon]
MTEYENDKEIRRKRNPWKLAEEGEVVDTLAQARIGEVNCSRWHTGEKPRKDILESIKGAYRRLGPGKLDDDLRDYFEIKSDLIAIKEVKDEIQATKDRRITYKVEEEIQEEIDETREKLEELTEEPELKKLCFGGIKWEEEINKIAEEKLDKYREKYDVDKLEDK